MVFSKLTLPLAGLVALVDRAHAKVQDECEMMCGDIPHLIQIRRRLHEDVHAKTSIHANAVDACVSDCVNTLTGKHSTADMFFAALGAGGGSQQQAVSDVGLAGYGGGINGICKFEQGPCIHSMSSKRTYNGRCNNLQNTEWGSAGEVMPRGFFSSQGGGNSRDNTSGKCSACYQVTTSLPSNQHDIRLISNSACTNTNALDDISDDGGSNVPWDAHRSDAAITWAQLMDHDLDATTPFANADTTSTNECTIAGGSATDEGGPIELGTLGDGTMMGQKRTCDKVKNVITSYIDAGILYGESVCERNRLFFTAGSNINKARSSAGTDGEYLPTNLEMDNCSQGQCDSADSGVGMANPTGRSCFFAGDFRAGENPALTAYHTMFLRLHNNIVDEEPSNTFEETRATVIATEQAISYNEWLPAYTGALEEYYTFGSSISHFGGGSALPTYNVSSYSASIRGSTRQQFATGTFRQHTAVSGVMSLSLSSEVLELDQTFFESCVWFLNSENFVGCKSMQKGEDSDTDVPGHGPGVTLFGTHRPSAARINGLCDILAGQHENPMRRGGTVMITEQRNQLFYKKDFYGNNKASGASNDGGSSEWEGFSNLDLVGLNIFRGRDHGITSWNSYATAFFGSNSVYPHLYCKNSLSLGCTTGNDVTAAYPGSHTDVDLWVGALAEKKIRNYSGVSSALGSVLTRDVVTQFRDVRDGDRFWFEGANGAAAFGGLKEVIENTTDSSCGCMEEGNCNPFLGAGASTLRPGMPLDRIAVYYHEDEISGSGDKKATSARAAMPAMRRGLQWRAPHRKPVPEPWVQGSFLCRCHADEKQAAGIDFDTNSPYDDISGKCGSA